MEKKYITRREAAEIFNVHPQTIGNWIAKGLLLAGNRDTTGTLVDYQSVEMLRESFGDIGEVEKNIKEYKAKITKLENEYRQTCKNLTDRNWVYSEIYKNADMLADLFDTAYSMLTLDKDYKKVLTVKMFLKGHTLSEIALGLEIPQERVRRLLSMGINRLKRIKNCTELVEENKRLLDQITKISTENIALKEVQDAIHVKESQTKNLLDTKIRDLNLSVRIISGLRTINVYTLGDLTRQERHKVYNIRNIGKNSMQELDDLLKSYNLDWNDGKPRGDE